MNTKANDGFTGKTITFDLREWPFGPSVSATCSFTLRAIGHVVAKHFGRQEPWKRILNASHADRLDEVAASRNSPTPADCNDFVDRVAESIKKSCERPRFCVFLDCALHEIDEDGRLRPRLSLRQWEKVLFVLDSGAVAFLKLLGPRSATSQEASFRTAFFPRAINWVAPKRAAAEAAARYVTRWAETPHPTGGYVLPKPVHGVKERDDESGIESQREFFRFTTPETWGFQLQADGEWVWYP